MTLKKSLPFKALPLALAIGLVACGEDNLNPDALNAPSTYTFDSKTQPGVSTVNYQEATTRLILIEELNHLIQSDYLQTLGENSTYDDVLSLLTRFYTIGTKTHSDSLSTKNVYDEYDPQALEAVGATPLKSFDIGENQVLIQADFSDLAPNINLQDKIIGLNTPLALRNEVDEEFGQFFGWRNYHTSNGDPIPNRVVIEWLEIIAQLATDGDPETKTISNNTDYGTLLHSFLMTSVVYAEVTNNLLNTSKLDIDNSPSDDVLQTPLEQQWDLAFGYFGAARDLDYTHLSESDSSSLDVFENANFNLPIMSMYFDEKSPLSDITLTKDIMQSFIEGRYLISEQVDVSAIEKRAETIIKTWEKILVAQVLRKMREISFFAPIIDIDNSFKTAYISAWSEMKALLIGLEFNPYSSLTFEEFKDIHTQLQSTIPMTDSAISNFTQRMKDVSELLQERFHYSDANVGSW